MKLKNNEILNLNTLIKSIGDNAPISNKWQLALAAEDLIVKAAMVQNELNNIIEKEGHDEEGKKVLEKDNKSVIELLKLTTDVKISKFDVEFFEPFNLPMDMLIALKKLIK